jgi:hypothetical protein
MAKLAAKVAPSTAMWFWAKAGFEHDDFQYLFPEFKRMVEDSELRIEQKLKSSTSDAVLVPIVRTPLPGQLRFPPSSEQIEDYLSLPTHLIQADWKLIAIRISDQFVRPIFSKGDIVLVDASSTNLIRGIYLTPPTPRYSVFGHGRGLSEDVAGVGATLLRRRSLC